MKILLVYPGTRHSTYDVALGYHEALEEMGHIVCPYRFENYLDYHAGAIEHWKKTNPNFNLTDEQIMESWMRWASETIIVHIVDVQPDLILIVAGLTIPAHTYALMGRINVPKVVMLTECPYIDDKQAEILSHGYVHMAFVNDKNSVDTIAEMTGKPVVYLPHSYAPNRHYPGLADEEHQTDVYFHGTWWPERGRLFDRMMDGLNGDYKIRVVGVGWKDGIGQMQYVTANDELANWYRGTRVALNHHRTITQVGKSEKHISSGAAWSIGPRAYEIAACGAFQLCDDTRPELGEVFGESVATYDDAEDLKFKIEYFLRNDGHRKLLAKEALERVTSCSFVNRAEQILLPAILEVFG